VTDIFYVDEFIGLKNPHCFRDYSCLCLQADSVEGEPTVMGPLERAGFYCATSFMWSVQNISYIFSDWPTRPCSTTCCKKVCDFNIWALWCIILCFTGYKCFGLLEFFKNFWTCGVLSTCLWVVISVYLCRYAVWYVVVSFWRVHCRGSLWCRLRTFTPRLDGHGHRCLWSDVRVFRESVNDSYMWSALLW
jgi:hypothetical protein